MKYRVICHGCPIRSCILKESKPHTEPMTIFTNSPEMQATWDDLMAGLFSFVADTQSDLDTAHDWLCDQLQIDSLLTEETMCEVDDDCWSSFYETWKSAYDGINWWGSEIPA